MKRAIRFVQELDAEVRRVADVAAITPRRDVPRLLLAWLRLTIAQRRGARGGRGFRLRWNGPRGLVQGTVFDPSEIRVIREMFVNCEYELPDEVDPKVILDLGSNAGMSILYFHNRYPDARIIGVEASPVTFDRLRHNTAELGNVEVHHAAAVGRSRPVLLAVGSESWSASIHGDSPGENVYEVAGRTIEQLLAAVGETRADLIKMDIEGCEGEILTTSSAVRKADWLIFEFHQEHSDGDVWSLIRQLGDFEIVRVTGDAAQHPVVTLRRSSAVGSLLDGRERQGVGTTRSDRDRAPANTQVRSAT